MNFDFFDKFKDTTKGENGFKDLIDDLGEFLENKAPEKSLAKEKCVRKQTSFIQDIDSQVTTSYRDKMLLERSNILNNYAKETSDRGTMYFVYSKSSSKSDTYNLCVCEEGMSNKVISVEESKLPSGAGVDSVLRLQCGEYVLDEEATSHILSEIEKIITKLLEEQTLELKSYRIEGNKYEIVEISEDRAWIMNIDISDGECFEEIGISKEILAKCKTGDLLKFENGEYVEIGLGEVH